MSKTEKNLMDAFAGESQANRKYLAFAKQADKEGLPQVAKLFRAAAEAETIHAHAHLRCIRMYISRLKMSCDYLRISFITIWFRPLPIFIPSRPI